MLIIFTPKEKAKQLVNEKYGEVTYEALGENQSLGGIVSTRNLLLAVRSNGQAYDEVGRLVLDQNNLKIEILTDSKPISEEEKADKRKKYIEAAKISGPNIKDYSASLGEWGDNPRTEPRTRKIREIYVLCNGCKIPIWICDTLEPVLNWGENKKVGIDSFLRENYQPYLGLPLYKIPPIDFENIDINSLPEAEYEIIKSGKLDNCSSLAEQNIVLLQEACKRFGLNPILIDQRKLRDAGAYRKAVNAILENKENLEKRFGKENLFRVECPCCGKYIYNVEIQDGKIRGVCSGKVRKQITGELEEKYVGCGKKLEENVDYLYTNAMPNGKLLTAAYMSNSEVGVFYPDFEFVPENVATGELEKIIRTTGETFNSGVPKIVKTGWFTKDGSVENIFSILDVIPAEDIVERFSTAFSYSKIDIKQGAIEPILLSKLKSFSPPTDPKLMADVVYSLNGKSINLKKLNWDVNEKYVFELLRCLGRIRSNRILYSKPDVEWCEDYRTFMKDKYLTENEITILRKSMISSNASVRAVMETTYLASLVDK